MKLISISLGSKGNQKKFPESTLDAYSLKKYKLFYIDNKNQINQDIRELSNRYETKIPKEITAILFGELLPNKEKKQYLDKHLGNTKKD